jgi:hypothetical protein
LPVDLHFCINTVAGRMLLGKNLFGMCRFGGVLRKANPRAGTINPLGEINSVGLGLI